MEEFPPPSPAELCACPPDHRLTENFPLKLINTLGNWGEKKIHSELMEVGGGRDRIPMNLLLRMSKQRERSVPFLFAQTVPHVPMT